MRTFDSIRDLKPLANIFIIIHFIDNNTIKYLYKQLFQISIAIEMDFKEKHKCFIVFDRSR